MNAVYRVRKVVRGQVTAQAIVCPDSFSFMGDVDLASGEIIAEGNPNMGLKLQDRALIYREAKGSSGGCSVLIALARRGLAPAALVTLKPADYNMTEAAIRSKIPFVCSPADNLLEVLKTGDTVRVDADAGSIEVLREP